MYAQLLGHFNQLSANNSEQEEMIFFRWMWYTISIEWISKY